MPQLRRIASLVAATTLLLGLVPASAQAVASGTPSSPTQGPCRYTPTPDDPAVRPVSLPPDPRRTPDHGKVLVTLATNRGPIPMLLDRAEAPCTVQSFLHLLQAGFYNDTNCHRLTTYPTLSVLQCGDPSGTGEGGPGYQFRDELPTNLPMWPGDPADSPRRLYARGTLAMANAGPDTNGSQFFLVYKDSRLRPNYTIFGRILPVGLRTLDLIAAGGVAPTDPGAPLDGMPALSTHILLGYTHRPVR
jgi:peptidyl-prolyl cis-trans isomerase B (cyclophilin B)